MQTCRRLSLPVLCTVMLASGCAGPSIWEPLAQSNFAYPNSNVIPLQHTQGTTTRTYVAPFQTPNLNDAKLMQDAINQALQTSGGDLIIDGSDSIETTVIPLFIVTIFTEKVTVEGTAAKMEIGKRNL